MNKHFTQFATFKLVVVLLLLLGVQTNIFAQESALNFDGFDDHISIPHDAALNILDGDFTIEAWVKPDNKRYQTIASKGNGGLSNTLFIFQLDQNRMALFLGGAEWQYATTKVPFDTWSHIAVTFDFATRTASFYINGVLDVQRTYGGGSFTNTDTQPLFIGQQGYVCQCNYFDGGIDNLGIWNRASSASELASRQCTSLTGNEDDLTAFYDFNEATACASDNTNTTSLIDATGNGHTGTLTNFDLISPSTSCDYTSLELNGINQYIQVSHTQELNVMDGDFTFMAYVYPESFGALTIFSKGHGAGNNTTNGEGDGYIFSLNNGKIALHIGNQDAFGEWNNSNTTLPINEWSHVTVSFDYSTLTASFYVDGQPDGQSVYNATNFNTTTTSSFYIGRQGYSCNCNFFDGNIDEVAVFDTALTNGNITNNLFNFPIPTNYPGLVAYYDFCVGGADLNTLEEKTSNGFDGTMINMSLTGDPACASNYIPEGIYLTPSLCDMDEDGVTVGEGDCNDNDDTIYPGAIELCDGIDNNCNGTADDFINLALNKPAVATNTSGANIATNAVDGNISTGWNSGQYAPQSITIDLGADYNIGSIRLNIDILPNGTPTHNVYFSSDGVNFGAPVDIIQVFNEKFKWLKRAYDGTQSARFVRIETISSPSWIAWFEIEIYEYFDGQTAFYADMDGDGFGDIDNCVFACSVPVGFVTDNTDCDDSNDTVYPNAPELCDGLDNDCDGMVEDSPVIECRQPISTTVTAGACERIDLSVLPPFVFDNCDVSITRTPAGNNFPVGTTTLLWTVMNSSGNPAQCESLVIIQDNEPPSVNSCNTSIDFLEPGSCLANVSIDVNAQDACGVASVEGSGDFILPIGIHPKTITITDVNGNQTVHTVTVYVHDLQSPIVTLCPQDITVESSTIPTSVNLTEPQFSDNCGIFSIENDAPDAFPLGTTAVTYTAMDEYGNWVNCSYNVNVISSVSFDNTIDNIETSTPTAEGVSWIDWNRPQTQTSCETCAETDYPDYLYLGDFNGHQYFLFAGAVNWSEASILSSEMNGHLVSMNEKDENAFLQSQLPTTELDVEPTTYWTGLNDSNIDIEWENGDALDYFNFPYDVVLNSDSLNAAVLNTDGTWTMTNGEYEAGFIMERPCMSIVQTAPLVEVISAAGDTTNVLLTPDSDWDAGTYTVTYEATDMCNNTASYSFDIDIAEEDAEYCNTGGTQHDVWVKRVVIEDQLIESEDATSYTDNTAEGIVLSESNTVAIQLVPGGVDLTSNTNLLYWRIWLDLNNDGDFFDANEQVYETSSTSIVNLELPISADLFGQTLRSRISVATQQYPEACLEFADGEAEDYTIVFPEMSEEARPKEGNFSLYPNPADNYTNIYSTDFRGENVVVTVYDNLGKVRLETKGQIEAGEAIRLDLRKFIDGIYFVKVQIGGKRMMTKRLVVDKFYGWVPVR